MNKLSQYNDSRFQSTIARKAIEIALLISAALGSTNIQAEQEEYELQSDTHAQRIDTEDRYTGTWSNYILTESDHVGAGTQALITDNDNNWTLGYRGESVGNNTNHTIVGAFRIGEHYMIVPTHAETTVTGGEGKVTEQNSHLEIHRIDPGYIIDHITVSGAIGKTYGNEFEGEKWKGFGVSVGGNIDIGHHHGYLYASGGQEYIKNGEKIPYGSIEYHSGKLRASIFATENNLREYKAEYGNGQGWKIGISHTQGITETTRVWLGYILTFGNNKAGDIHHLNSTAIVGQGLFATDITNLGEFTRAKGEWTEEKEDKKHK